MKQKQKKLLDYLQVSQSILSQFGCTCGAFFVHIALKFNNKFSV